MSECSPEWATPRLPVTVGDAVPVEHLSWKRVTQLAVQAEAGGGQVEKRLLRALQSSSPGTTFRGLGTRRSAPARHSAAHRADYAAGSCFSGGVWTRWS